MENQNLYIRVIEGKPFEHPVVEENLFAVVKNFDPNNLPEGIEKFVRKHPPVVGFLETFVGTTYQKIDGVWQDVHEIRPLTEAEKNYKIKFMRDNFPFQSWDLDEQTGEWIPPVPYPTDDKLYMWNDEIENWVEVEGGCSI